MLMLLFLFLLSAEPQQPSQPPPICGCILAAKPNHDDWVSWRNVYRYKINEYTETLVDTSLAVPTSWEKIKD